MMHEDSLTPYRKYIDNILSSQHNSFCHFTCYYKTSASFVIIRHSSSIDIIYVGIIQHYTTSSLHHHSTLYNIVITQHRPQNNIHNYSPL